MNKKNRFLAEFPGTFFLETDTLLNLNAYLQKNQIISKNESVINAEVPGAGNMNYVLRLKTENQSFIIKQARPWVEKYPTIDAPVERIKTEAKYYQVTNEHQKLSNHSPKIIHYDPDNFIIIMEDLGSIDDLSFAYNTDENITLKTISKLAKYLSELHDVKVKEFPSNQAMKLLNHDHIFNIPFDENNGLELDAIQDGLQEIGKQIHHNTKLKSKVSYWGKQYLEEKESLIHGDFYPGSIMTSNDKTYVLDPEFGFKGLPSFDLGVFVAHLHMADQKSDLIAHFIDQYKSKRTVENKALWSFAGIEIIRRLIGVAQIPLSIDISFKKKLIEKAINWIE